MTRVNTSVSFSAKKYLTQKELPKTTIKLDVLIKYLRKDEALRSLFLQLIFRSISLSQIEKETRKTKYLLHTINGYVELLLNIYIFYSLHHITMSYPPYFKKNPAI